jgi:hypothetical protein
MALTTQDQKVSSLKAGKSWSSFEKFRTEGANVLEPVKDGAIATLQTKTGQYRILEEQDFQKLLGLARDVERLRGGLRVVVGAVRVAQKHPDTESLNLLLEAVTMLGNLPLLTLSEGFPPLSPEGLDVDPDDEVTLDPNQIERPLSGDNVVSGE